jgi:ABC-type multidrug transport system fused ATPase/permease subunit
MEKIVFKNEYLNITLGAVLIVLALVGYFTHFIEEYSPIIIGVVLILLSVKRFAYSFKKITSKNATLILVIEIVLDLVFAGLLIYLQEHLELFVGLIVYTRGVSYLLINYIATRKVKVLQYLLNIVYVTFGSFLMFTSYSSVEFLAIFIFLLTLFVGGVFVQIGLKKIVLLEKQEELQEEETKRKEKLEKIEAKSEKKITKLKTELNEVKEEQKKINDRNKPAAPKGRKIEPIVSEGNNTSDNQDVVIKVNLESLTIAELKVIAKERNITGLSQLNKSEIIAKLKK